MCTAKVSTVISNYFNRKGGDVAIGSRKQRAKRNPEENTQAVLVRFLFLNPIIHQAEIDKGYQRGPGSSGNSTPSRTGLPH